MSGLIFTVLHLFCGLGGGAFGSNGRGANGAGSMAATITWPESTVMNTRVPPMSSSQARRRYNVICFPERITLPTMGRNHLPDGAKWSLAICGRSWAAMPPTWYF